jgi:hypothetical protein
VSLFDENMKKKFHVGKNLLVLGLDLDTDLDPHSSKRLDQDPHIMYADPKHYSILYFILRRHEW